jgi:uncharacterized protein HemY
MIIFIIIIVMIIIVLIIVIIVIVIIVVSLPSLIHKVSPIRSKIYGVQDKLREVEKELNRIKAGKEKDSDLI